MTSQWAMVFDAAAPARPDADENFGDDVGDAIASLEEALTSIASNVAALLRDVGGDAAIHLYVDGTSSRVSIERATGDGRPPVPLTLQVSPLSEAEQRVLRYLPTSLTFPEIAAQLGVSRHTIKSHASSIYRKFGVSCRSAAVEVGCEQRLLTRYVVLPAPSAAEPG